VTTTQFGRSKLVGRAFDYFSFYASARRTLLTVTRRDDLLVAMTDPPLISLVAMEVAWRRRAHLVNWLQDIYPEVAAQLGVPFLKGPALRSISTRSQSKKGGGKCCGRRADGRQGRLPRHCQGSHPHHSQLG
jgi:hypothetical protein